MQATFHGVDALRVNNLLLYRIQVLTAYPQLTQAIFTRLGGVSSSPYHSLNFSSTVGDDPLAVEQNIQLACQTLGFTPAETVSCYQVHGADILTIEPTHTSGIIGQADGLVTNIPKVYLLLRFADCTPLIFFDPVRNIVGLAHAGWRGTVQNVAGATVQAMVKLGCRPADIIAVIGPSIGSCCYEVGTEVVQATRLAFNSPEMLFYAGGQNLKNWSDILARDTVYFDMATANHRQLEASGLKQIVQTHICTACQVTQFFSHRAEGGRTGRFGVMIGLKSIV